MSRIVRPSAPLTAATLLLFICPLFVPLSACSDAQAGGNDGDDGDHGDEGGAGAGAGAAGGGGGGPPCEVAPSDPSAVVRALVVEGGSLVEAMPPAPMGSHPSVTNGVCSQAKVRRGEQLIVPFGFGDTDTPVAGCLVTVDGATNHIAVDAAHCDGGLEIAGELPLRVTIPEEMCPGTFTLRYAAMASAPAISSYLPTVIEVTNEVADGVEPQLCVAPEPPPLSGITAQHNRVRSYRGSPPLLWDESLAAYAQTGADGLAATAQWPPDVPAGYGVNVVAFGAPQEGPLVITPNDVVITFLGGGGLSCFEENTPYPQCCSSCEDTAALDCPQYTQTLWATSERLGCAVAAFSNPDWGGEGEVWLCVYDPPGNQEGQIPF